MFCSNCGKEIPDGAKFCGYCGTANAVAAEVAKQTEQTTEAVKETVSEAISGTTGQSEYFTEESNASQEAPKKKGKGGKIAAIIAAVAAVAAVIVGVVFFAGKNFEHTIHKTFDKPKDYYSYVEKKNFAAMSDTMKSEEVQKIMNQLKDSSNASVSETVKLKLGSKGKQFTALANDLAGVDLSWIENVGIKYSVNVQEEKIKATLAPILNDSTLLNAAFMLDLKAGMIYGGFPDLSEKYFGISFGDDYDFEEIKEEMGKVFEVYENMLNAYPDPEKLEELSMKYYDVIMENVEEVVKGKATLEAGEVSAECTLLTVELSNKDIQKIAKAVLEELSKDKDFEKILRDFYGSMGEMGDVNVDELLEEYQTALKDAIENVDQISIDKFILENYVDKNGEIIGRNVTMKKGDEKVSIKYANVAKGDDRGFEISAKIIDNSFSVIGNGKEKGGKYNCEFVVSVDDKKYVNVAVEDYDVDAAKKGNLVGTFTIKPGKDAEFEDVMEELADELGNNTIAGIIRQMNPSLKISVNVDSDAQKHELAFTILGDGEELITLSFEGEVNKAEDVTMPSDYIRIDTEGNFDEQELIDYVKGLDLDLVIDALEKANLPEEWLNTLKQYKSMLPQLLEYGLR